MKAYELHELCTAFVQRGDRAGFQRVIDAIDSGDVEVVMSATGIRLRVRRSGPRMELADRLADLREQSGKTYQQISAETEVSLSAVNRYFSGRALGSWAMLALIIRCCDGDPKYFRELYDQARGQRFTDM